METGILLGLAHSLAALTYACGVLVQTLPLPHRAWRAYGPQMMRDSCLTEIAIGTISVIQMLVTVISETIGTSLIGGPLTSSASNKAFETIISQLVTIDTTIFGLIHAVSAVGSSDPATSILARILGSAVDSCTTAIILWYVIRAITQFLPTAWLTGYELGLCFYVLPLRIGRRLGSFLMATSLVLAIGMPLTPFLALQLQGPTDFETFLKEFENIAEQIIEEPSRIVELISSIPEATGRMMSAVFISLIFFPVIYLFLLSLIIRSVASLIGGSARGLTITRFILGPVT